MSLAESKMLNGYRGSFFSIELLLPVFMLLEQYKIGLVGMGTMLLIVVVIFAFVRNPSNIRFPLLFWPFYVILTYFVVCDIFRAMLGPDAVQTQINRMIEYVVMFFLVFAVCSQPFDEDRLYKYWKIAGAIFSIGIIYHVFQIYFLGQSISAITIIPGYELRSDDAFDQLRPSSFFAEPAAFVNSMLPLLFLSLKRKDYRWAFFCTVSILLSTSTVGVFLSGILWMMSLISKKDSKKSAVTKILIILPVLWMFVNLDVFSETQSKFLAVTEGESSFGARVLTGFEIVGRMSFSDLIFGTRYNDVASFVSNNIDNYAGCENVLRYWYFQRLFLNTFSRLIFQYGIVGLFLFLTPLILFLRKKLYEAKSLVVMILVAIFGQTMLLNAYFFVLIMILLLYANKTEGNYFEVVK